MSSRNAFFYVFLAVAMQAASPAIAHAKEDEKETGSFTPRMITGMGLKIAGWSAGAHSFFWSKPQAKKIAAEVERHRQTLRPEFRTQYARYEGKRDPLLQNLLANRKAGDAIYVRGTRSFEGRTFLLKEGETGFRQLKNEMGSLKKLAAHEAIEITHYQNRRLTGLLNDLSKKKKWIKGQWGIAFALGNTGTLIMSYEGLKKYFSSAEKAPSRRETSPSKSGVF